VNTRIEVTLDASSVGFEGLVRAITIGDLDFVVRVEGIPKDQSDELASVRRNYADALDDLHHERANAEKRQQDYLALKSQYDALRLASDPTMTDVRAKAKQYIKDNPGLHINAIKYIREMSGLGLKEAKDMHDALKAEVQAEAATGMKFDNCTFSNLEADTAPPLRAPLSTEVPCS
jgi:ribosomal protein L7/L12